VIARARCRFGLSDLPAAVGLQPVVVAGVGSDVVDPGLTGRPNRTGCCLPGSWLGGTASPGWRSAPVRRDVEPAGFGGGQGVFVSLGGGAGRIQFHQMILIFEHTSCISA
jgi:hypothetical protein